MTAACGLVLLGKKCERHCKGAAVTMPFLFPWAEVMLICKDLQINASCYKSLNYTQLPVAGLSNEKSKKETTEGQPDCTTRLALGSRTSRWLLW